MTTWKSTSELANELGLRVDLDRGGLLDEIRGQMVALHPDRNGGEFTTAEAAARFRRLAEAQEFLKTNSPTALVPMGELTAFVKTLMQSAERQLSHSRVQVRAEFREIARAEIRHGMVFPRIGSGVFAVACGFLLTVADKLKDFPILGTALARPGAKFALASMLPLAPTSLVWP